MTDRFIAAIRALVRDLFPSLDFLGFYAYSVASFDEASQSADLRPLRAGKGLPVLKHIDVRAPACKVKLLPGGTVLVGFEDGDPSQPFVAFFDRASTYATALPAARQGDLVQVTIPPTMLTAVSGGIGFNPTAVGPAGIVTYGTISTGSAVVKTQS
jgi:hypothetical protein